MKQIVHATALILTSPFLCAAAAQTQGPSSSATPYLVPVGAGVQTVSILTVGDSIGGYPLVGIPDGMGARLASSTEVEIVLNHELTSAAGAVHSHGQTGAFVSKWTLDRTTLAVTAGSDLIQNLNFVSGSAALGRLCSGDMPNRKALFINVANEPYVFLSGEEVGSEGRAFAHVVTGTEAGQSYELPYLGKFSWENCVARPFRNRRTVVAGLDDSTPGQVYFYIGDKQRTGNVAERAGLANGHVFGVRVPGAALEDRTNILNGATTFELADLGNVSAKTGAQLQADSVAAGVTEFLRPEDGVWDPADPRVFYFVTTDRFNNASQVGRSRLWRLTFLTAGMPELGGTIEVLLDGTEGQQMMDNLTIDQRGHLLIQEDPGNQAYLARVLQYTIATDTLSVVAEHDPARFVTGAAGFLTADEESSGIIDASALLGPGWFLLDVQAHYALPSPLIEGGQMLALFNPDSL
jgi:hypothetical protein